MTQERELVSNLQDQILEDLRRFAVSYLDNLTENTRKDTKWASAGWNISAGPNTGSYEPDPRPKKPGAYSLAGDKLLRQQAARTAFLSIPADILATGVTISNSVPYIGVLEDADKIVENSRPAL